MKRERTFIKTNIKTKAIIIFLIFALFCIFGILACGSKDLPTSSVSEGDWNNEDEIVNDNTNVIKTNFTTNLPTFGKNESFTNLLPSEPEPTPEPTPDKTPKPDTFPQDSFYSVHYFKNLTSYGEESVSYKDTDKLSKIWTNIIVANFYIQKGSSKLRFKPNGDIYWEKKPETILKKFEGGTIVMYRGGEFSSKVNADWKYTVAGVYTYGVSRSEANSWGNEAVNKMFNQEYDSGGKKGKIELLVVNSGYLWNGGTGRPGHFSMKPLGGLILIEHNSKLQFAGFQSYNQRADDRLSRYLYLDETIVRPEQNMRTLQNTWDLWE